MNVDEIAKDVADQLRTALEEAQELAKRIVADAEAEATKIREKAESEAKAQAEKLRQALALIELPGEDASTAEDASSESSEDGAPSRPNRWAKR